MNPLSILIAHEQPAIRRELRCFLDLEPEVVVTGEVDTSEDAFALLCRLQPDVILMDLSSAQKLQVSRGSEAYPQETRSLVMVTAMERSQIVDAFGLGADGIVLQGTLDETLLNSIRSARAGTYWLEGESARVLIDVLREFLAPSNGSAMNGYGLTPRELEIVAKITDGHSNRELGLEFSISERTVKHHLTNIFTKVGVSSRLELALFAMNHRLTAAHPQR